jgi:Transmembrane protein 43
MRDRYVEVETIGWGRRLRNSVGGFVFGLLAFVLSFVLLFWNEGRTDLSQLAKGAIVLSANQSAPAAQGKLVALSGSLTTNQPLGDAPYLPPGNFAIVERLVEMHAWEEDESTRSVTNRDGSETKETTYTYNRVWESTPKDSTHFRYTKGHENPKKALSNQFQTAPQATVGQYRLNMAAFTHSAMRNNHCDGDGLLYFSTTGGSVIYPRPQPIPLVAPTSIPAPNSPLGNIRHYGQFLYWGAGSPPSPQIGDLRICYFVMPNPTAVTIFGKLVGQQIEPLPIADYEILYRMHAGSREAAIAQLKTEHQMWLWVLRFVGFVMMWLGLEGITKPMTVLMSGIPVLGVWLEDLAGLANFGLALVLSGITILVSKLAHSPLVLLITVSITIVTFVVVRKGVRKAIA